MNEYAQTLIDGLMEVEEVVGATITWAGTTYPCSHGTVVGGKLLGEGGYRTTAAVTLAVRTSLFSGQGLPASKQTISYKNNPDATAVTLNINSITNIYGEILTMECDDPNQGA